MKPYILVPILLAACASEPTIWARAPQTLSEPMRIAVRGAKPGAEVRLTIERPSDWQPKTLIRATVVFEADERGRVDTTTDAPTSGYAGVDPFGPFWTAQPTDDAAPTGASPNDVVIRADVDEDGLDDLGTTATLPFGGGVVVEDALGEAFPGAFLVRPAKTGDRRPPVVVILGGSGGGDGAARFMAPRIASLGYAALGLPYYSPAWFGQKAQFPELPRDFVELPIDYIEDAVATLRRRDDIDPDRIALHGTSKGGEMALLAASLIPNDSVGGGYCAVAAIVPSDVVWEGWGASSDDENGSPGFSWRGVPLPFVPYKDIQRSFTSRGTDDAVPLRVPHDEGRAENPDRVLAALIDLQAIDEPVYALGGDADTTWDSGGMTRKIAERRGDLPTVALSYEDADHGLSGTAFRPASPGTAAARKDAWPKLVAFFARHLGEDGCVDARTG